jgi:hypothetical protein
MEQPTTSGPRPDPHDCAPEDTQSPPEATETPTCQIIIYGYYHRFMSIHKYPCSYSL